MRAPRIKVVTINPITIMTECSTILCAKHIVPKALYEFDFFGRLRQTNN
jgi:hypothetical protein